MPTNYSVKCLNQNIVYFVKPMSPYNCKVILSYAAIPHNYLIYQPIKQTSNILYSRLNQVILDLGIAFELATLELVLFQDF